MQIRKLNVHRLRVFAEVELAPGMGANVVFGRNGSGKTSLIEAIALLGSGKSFRTGTPEVLVRSGESSCMVHAEVVRGASLRSLGIARERRRWRAQVDGADVQSLGELYRHCAVVVFHPGSHELITGPSELKRRFLDWALFHVEPMFYETWRRFQRALRQRNLALSQRACAETALASWEAELARNGETIHDFRVRCVAQLEVFLSRLCEALFSEPGQARLVYRRGWSDQFQGLHEALIATRESDRLRGFTSVGPHRAGFQLSFARLAQREHFSRGQQKLAALCLQLAQAAYVRDAVAEVPILCFDDLCAELDVEYQSRVLDWLSRSDAQVFITTTHDSAHILRSIPKATLFHVEQAQVTRRL